MANKRLLKKQIKYICGDIAGECIMSRYLIPGIDSAKMEEIVLTVATLQASTLKRVTFDFDKSKDDFSTVKEFNIARSKYFAEAYKTLSNDFNNSIKDIVKSMNEALPQSQKEENKRQINN